MIVKSSSKSSSSLRFCDETHSASRWSKGESKAWTLPLGGVEGSGGSVCDAMKR